MIKIRKYILRIPEHKKQTFLEMGTVSTSQVATVSSSGQVRCRKLRRSPRQLAHRTAGCDAPQFGSPSHPRSCDGPHQPICGNVSYVPEFGVT